MDNYQATVLQGGRPVLTGVDVFFLHGGAFVHDASWSGYFYLPEGGFIAHGGPYELLLGDGRRGQVLVRETRPEEGGRILVEFTGIGRFPH